ncbi:MAG TPA: PhoX family phosphatase, partial [Vicinamibacterales bacterium]
QTAADQEKQFGMHCDGQHFFPFATRGASGASSDRGVYCVNNEYTHEGILHPDGLFPGNGGLPGSVVTIAKVRKSQAAHGVSILELRKVAGKWGVIPASPFGRRITANTPMKVSGPAAGHALLQSRKYGIQPGGSTETGVNDGFSCNGTLNNCAHGYTPWGTYLTCEENWNGNFGTAAAFTATKLERRYGVGAAGFNYNWHLVDPRFDIRANPLETNLFGWVIEIDPFDPKSTPVKRTALGRFKHESAQVAVGNDNDVAFYQGDDERNEYVYKFVCEGKFDPRNRTANFGLLDRGTLYVARFTSQEVAGKPGVYRGEWVALKPDTIALDGYPLRLNPEFQAPTDAESQALILVKTRMAADAVGATMMDRPEWTALRTYWNPDPASPYGGYGPDRPLEVYCTMTNNLRRGNTPVSSNLPDGSSGAASTNPPVDVANPRPDNDYGHIVRWREDGYTPRATGFEWDIFVLCGDTQAAAHAPGPKTLPASYTPAGHDGYAGNIIDNPTGSCDFGAPDGLWFDPFGRMWIQTDQIGDGSGDFQKVGANTMLCADPNTKEIRRFLTSPNKCEVTGMHMTPDGRTLFVGIQHPGEDSTAADPDQFSNWPQSQFVANSAGVVLPNGEKRRPRSSVVVITKDDGGVIGGLA